MVAPSGAFLGSSKFGEGEEDNATVSKMPARAQSTWITHLHDNIPNDI